MQKLFNFIHKQLISTPRIIVSTQIGPYAIITLETIPKVSTIVINASNTIQYLLRPSEEEEWPKCNF